MNPVPTYQTVQDPQTVRDGNNVPQQATLTPVWRAWFSSLYLYVQALGGNGPTAARPVNNLYVGMQYFDTTLGYPVFLQSVTPAVWVNASGTPV